MKKIVILCLIVFLWYPRCSSCKPTRFKADLVKRAEPVTIAEGLRDSEAAAQLHTPLEASSDAKGVSLADAQPAGPGRAGMSELAPATPLMTEVPEKVAPGAGKPWHQRIWERVKNWYHTSPSLAARSARRIGRWLSRNKPKAKTAEQIKNEKDEQELQKYIQLAQKAQMMPSTPSIVQDTNVAAKDNNMVVKGANKFTQKPDGIAQDHPKKAEELRVQREAMLQAYYRDTSSGANGHGTNAVVKDADKVTKNTDGGVTASSNHLTKKPNGAVAEDSNESTKEIDGTSAVDDEAMRAWEEKMMRRAKQWFVAPINDGLSLPGTAAEEDAKLDRLVEKRRQQLIQAVERYDSSPANTQQTKAVSKDTANTKHSHTNTKEPGGITQKKEVEIKSPSDQDKQIPRMLLEPVEKNTSPANRNEIGMDEEGENAHLHIPSKEHHEGSLRHLDTITSSPANSHQTDGISKDNLSPKDTQTKRNQLDRGSQAKDDETKKSRDTAPKTTLESPNPHDSKGAEKSTDHSQGNQIISNLPLNNSPAKENKIGTGKEGETFRSNKHSKEHPEGFPPATVMFTSPPANSHETNAVSKDKGVEKATAGSKESEIPKDAHTSTNEPNSIKKENNNGFKLPGHITPEITLGETLSQEAKGLDINPEQKQRSETISHLLQNELPSNKKEIEIQNEDKTFSANKLPRHPKGFSPSTEISTPSLSNTHETKTSSKDAPVAKYNEIEKYHAVPKESEINYSHTSIKGPDSIRKENSDELKPGSTPLKIILGGNSPQEARGTNINPEQRKKSEISHSLPNESALKEKETRIGNKDEMSGLNKLPKGHQEEISPSSGVSASSPPNSHETNAVSKDNRNGKDNLVPKESEIQDTYGSNKQPDGIKQENNEEGKPEESPPKITLGGTQEAKGSDISPENPYKSELISHPLTNESPSNEKEIGNGNEEENSSFNKLSKDHPEGLSPTPEVSTLSPANSHGTNEVLQDESVSKGNTIEQGNAVTKESEILNDAHTSTKGPYGITQANNAEIHIPEDTPHKIPLGSNNPHNAKILDLSSEKQQSELSPHPLPNKSPNKQKAIGIGEEDYNSQFNRNAKEQPEIFSPETEFSTPSPTNSHESDVFTKDESVSKLNGIEKDNAVSKGGEILQDSHTGTKAPDGITQENDKQIKIPGDAPPKITLAGTHPQEAKVSDINPEQPQKIEMISPPLQNKLLLNEKQLGIEKEDDSSSLNKHSNKPPRVSSPETEISTPSPANSHQDNVVLKDDLVSKGTGVEKDNAVPKESEVPKDSHTRIKGPEGITKLNDYGINISVDTPPKITMGGTHPQESKGSGINPEQPQRIGSTSHPLSKESTANEKTSAFGNQFDNSRFKSSSEENQGVHFPKTESFISTPAKIHETEPVPSNNPNGKQNSVANSNLEAKDNAVNNDNLAKSGNQVSKDGQPNTKEHDPITKSIDSESKNPNNEKAMITPKGSKPQESEVEETIQKQPHTSEMTSHSITDASPSNENAIQSSDEDEKSRLNQIAKENQAKAAKFESSTSSNSNIHEPNSVPMNKQASKETEVENKHPAATVNEIPKETSANTENPDQITQADEYEIVNPEEIPPKSTLEGKKPKETKIEDNDPAKVSAIGNIWSSLFPNTNQKTKKPLEFQ